MAVDHSIVIVTTKPELAVGDIRDRLKAYDIPHHEHHITAEKWRVSCDVYLDDSPEQITELALQRPDRVVCRFVRPWNRAHPSARDIHDWDEFVALVDRIWC